MATPEKIEEYSVEQGYLTDAPIYEPHKRGKNWLAVIELDPDSPGGLMREFMKRGRGEDYYYSVKELEVGDVVEFGADYYSSGGHKSPRRVYAVVLDIKSNSLKLAEFGDKYRDAFKYAEEKFGTGLDDEEQDVLDMEYAFEWMDRTLEEDLELLE
jgi:hypothetical protein